MHACMHACIQTRKMLPAVALAMSLILSACLVLGSVKLFRLNRLRPAPNQHHKSCDHEEVFFAFFSSFMFVTFATVAVVMVVAQRRWWLYYFLPSRSMRCAHLLCFRCARLSIVNVACVTVLLHVSVIRTGLRLLITSYPMNLFRGVHGLSDLDAAWHKWKSLWGFRELL